MDPMDVDESPDGRLSALRIEVVDGNGLSGSLLVLAMLPGGRGRPLEVRGVYIMAGR